MVHDVMPCLPVPARLDGRAFHTFTRKCERPFDSMLHQLMSDTTRHLVELCGARVGYTQSDEISLLFYSEDPKSEIFFNGRIQKMVSTLAAMASTHFNVCGRELAPHLPWGMMPTFDARVWAVPTKQEAVNTFVWRQADAVRNSVMGCAQSVCSHKELQGLSVRMLIEKIHCRGISWNALPWRQRRGVFLQRRARNLTFASMTEAERNALPAHHQARKDPNLVVRQKLLSEC